MRRLLVVLLALFGLASVVGPAPTLGVSLALGLEGLLDPTTGLFAEAAYVYGFADFPKLWRFAFGVNFR